jgi:hypothetical protein
MGQPRYDATRNQYVYGDGPDDDVLQAVDGAITHVGGTHALTKGSAGAYTLTPPTAGEEGTRIFLVSRSAFAHVVTLTEGLGGKGAAFDVMTFAAVGDGIELQADNLHWVPVGAPYGVVIS